MTYPKPIHKFHPRYHYPDCAPPIAGEDNDCEYCIPFRLLSDEIQKVKEQGKEELADRHRNGWQKMRDGDISIEEVHSKYYNPGPEIANNREYMKLRTIWNEKLREKIREVDTYFAKQDCIPMELDLKDEEERPNDAMEIDSNGIEKESSPKKANSSKILSNGMEVMLEWDNEGIVFDHKEHLWTTIKYWQNKVRRQTKDPIRTRFWKGPYATCWCIYQKAYC